MRSTLACAAAAIALAVTAHAQTSSTSSSSSTSTSGDQSPPPPASAKVKPLTVTGKQPVYRRDADKRSYSIADDLNAVHGSVADALRDIPSVDVDLQGNVSLRGDAAVTILVDGQPSALFSGQNRGQLLQQLPANQYDRVEVMTNPSAAYSPEGTGGIINLITKKTHEAAPSGTLSITGSTNGENRASASGSGAIGKLSVTGALTYATYDAGGASSSVGTIEDPASGEIAAVTDHAGYSPAWQSLSASGEATYQLDADTRLTNSSQLFWSDGRIASFNTYSSSASGGPLALDYKSSGRQLLGFVGGLSNAGVKHTVGGDDDRYVSIDLTLVDTRSSSDFAQTFAYSTPVQPNLFQDIASIETNASAHLQAEYHAPLPNSAKLVVGYELDAQHLEQDRQGAFGASSSDAAPEPALTDDFRGDQTVHSLYATYDRPIGDLDIQPGLRLEQALTDTDDATVGARGRNSYFQAYPTLELAYRLASGERLTASFSRRIQRPWLEALSPARLYLAPLAYSQGDPRLKPTVTDDYELAYEFTGKSLYYLATLYFKDQGDQITQLTDNFGGGATLSTYGNVGHDRTAGLELTGNAKLSTTLALRATFEAKWDDLQDPGLIVGGDRAGVEAWGSLKLDWTPTARDFVQFDGHAFGRQLNAQGFTEPFATFNLGYRRRLTDRISAEFRVTDLFNGSHVTSVIETPTLSQRSTNAPSTRAAFFTLSYALGAVAKQPQADFDFNSGGAPGAGH